MGHVLFVDTGNVCRSAFAERYAAVAAARRGAGSVRFSSAGIDALEYAAMDPFIAAEVVARGGVAGGFRARQLVAPMFDDVDVVLTMTLRQRFVLGTHFPFLPDATFSIGHFARIAELLPKQIDYASLAAQVGRVPAKLTSRDDMPDYWGSYRPLVASVANRIAEEIDIILGRVA